MWLEKGAPRTDRIFLVAGSLAGCATSSINLTDIVFASNEQLPSEGFMASFNPR